MGCIGDYEVVEHDFTQTAPVGYSQVELPFDVTVPAPDGKVVLGGALRFGDDNSAFQVTWTGGPSADGSSWTFRVTRNYNGASIYSPFTGTAVVTTASMGG